MMASWHPDFDLAGWRVSPKLNRISKGNRSVSVKHKAMAVLVRLAEADGEVVTRDEIMDAVWPGMVVSDDVLTQSIVELRKAFGDAAKHPTIIETIPRIGLRLVSNVVPAGKADAKPRTNWPHVSALLIALVFVAFGFLYWSNRTEMQSRSPVIVVQEKLSIAVLPFVNMSNDSQNSFIADGLAEDIRNLLSRIRNLRVIARTSSHAFENKDKELRNIADALGVDFVLEGSVQEVSDRVRISVRLVDVTDESTIWSERYDESLSDIFALQDSVAAAVIKELQVRVSAPPIRRRPTEDLDAYLQLLEAKAAANRHDMLRAIDILEEITTREPDFAEAQEFLSYIYWAIAGNPIDIVEAHRRAYDAAAKAVAVNPDLVFANALYKAGGIGEFSLANALDAIHESLVHEPENALLIEANVFLLSVTGYLDEALRYARRLVDVDPLSRQARFNWAMCLYAVGRSDDARAALHGFDWSDVGPDIYKWMVEGINFMEARDEVAIDSFEQYLQQNRYPDSSWFRKLVTEARDPARGVSALDEGIPRIVASMANQDPFNWQDGLSSLYLYLGFSDRFLDLVLEKDFDATSWFAETNQIWQANTVRRTGITASPAYLELMRRANVTDVWEQRGPPDFCEKLDGQWVCE